MKTGLAAMALAIVVGAFASPAAADPPLPPNLQVGPGVPELPLSRSDVEDTISDAEKEVPDSGGSNGVQVLHCYAEPKNGC